MIKQWQNNDAKTIQQVSPQLNQNQNDDEPHSDIENFETEEKTDHASDTGNDQDVSEAVHAKRYKRLTKEVRISNRLASYISFVNVIRDDSSNLTFEGDDWTNEEPLVTVKYT